MDSVIIFGHGVTGTATGEVFKRAGFEVRFVDPPKGEWENPDGRPRYVFLCVPTPTGDTSYVLSAALVAARRYKAPIVVRSTVSPGTVEMLERETGAQIILMPEFLREQCAIEDALRRDKAIYATVEDEVAENFARFLAEAGYQAVRRVSVPACELVKIALNGMLAVKVAFANVLYDLARDSGASHDELVDLLLVDGWLSRFGLQVPGRHGRGYAGTCLPKDLGWLIRTLHERNIDGWSWLDDVQLYNGRLRAGPPMTPRDVVKA